MRGVVHRIVAAACLLLIGSAVAAPTVPVKAFARKAQYQSAKISPNGEFLAVTVPWPDQTVLAVLDLRKLKPAGVLELGPGFHVADYWWVSPKRVVVSVAERAGPLDQPYLTGELYGMDADGSRRRYLAGFPGGGGHAWMLNPLPEDPDHALMWFQQYGQGYAYPHVTRLNVNTGREKVLSIVQVLAPFAIATDRAGRLRFAYGVDNSDRHEIYLPNAAGELRVRKRPPWGEPEWIDLHGASADGSVVYLTDGQRGRMCLREYRFDRAAFVERLCRDSGSIGAPILSLDAWTLIGFLDETRKPEITVLEEGHADTALYRKLHKAFGGQRVTVTSQTLDGKLAVVLVDGDRNPGDFYLVNRETSKAEYLISRRQWIDPEKMAPVEPVSYKTRDGVMIHGYLTAAGGNQARKQPMVLMPHGGPHGVRDFWQWDPDAQALASRGYAVLQVNFRGSGGFGDAHEEAGHRKWGTLMQDDLTDAVRWAIDAGIADKDRICIFGASYGGYAALMSPLREPGLYRCAIAFAGVYDLVAQAEDSDTAESRFGRKYLARVLGNDALKAEQSPLTHVEKLRIPVLIGHGTADTRVPFSQAKMLRKALDHHKKPYEWMEFQNEEHGFHDDKNHEAFLTKVLEFLDKHIGAGAGAAAAPG